MFRWEWWSDALTRAFRTFCQTLVASLGGSALNIWNVGWHNALGVSAGSALLAILMAVDRLSSAPQVSVTVEPEPAPMGVSAPFGDVPVMRGCGDRLR